MPYINCTLQFKHWSVYNLQFLCYSVDKPNLTVDRTHEIFFFFNVYPGKSSLPVPFLFPVLHLYTYHGSSVSNRVENI